MKWIILDVEVTYSFKPSLVKVRLMSHQSDCNVHSDINWLLEVASEN